MTPREQELRRLANQNLRGLANGTVARRVEAERDAKEAEKRRSKADKVRLRKIDQRLKAVHKERDSLQEYLDQVLEDPNPLGYAEGMTGSQKQGLLEEIELAIEGCSREIGDLLEERGGI